MPARSARTSPTDSYGGLEAGAYEAFADDNSTQVKAGLAETLYPNSLIKVRSSHHHQDHLILQNPIDPAAFEPSYPDLVDRARKIPRVLKMETSKVWPKENGTPAPAYRMIHLCFPDYAAANTAASTPELGALFPRALELATGGARVVFANVEES